MDVAVSAASVGTIRPLVKTAPRDEITKYSSHTAPMVRADGCAESADPTGKVMLFSGIVATIIAWKLLLRTPCRTNPALLFALPGRADAGRSAGGIDRLVGRSGANSGRGNRQGIP